MIKLLKMLPGEVGRFDMGPLCSGASSFSSLQITQSEHSEIGEEVKWITQLTWIMWRDFSINLENAAIMGSESYQVIRSDRLRPNCFVSERAIKWPYGVMADIWYQPLCNLLNWSPQWNYICSVSVIENGRVKRSKTKTPTSARSKTYYVQYLLPHCCSLVLTDHGEFTGISLKCLQAWTPSPIHQIFLNLETLILIKRSGCKGCWRDPALWQKMRLMLFPTCHTHSRNRPETHLPETGTVRYLCFYGTLCVQDITDIRKTIWSVQRDNDETHQNFRGDKWGNMLWGVWI